MDAASNQYEHHLEPNPLRYAMHTESIILSMRHKGIKQHNPSAIRTDLSLPSCSAWRKSRKIYKPVPFSVFILTHVE